MKREVAEKAAKWWGDILCSHHDNGAKDEANNMGMIIADILAASNKPSEKRISDFVKVLADDLEKISESQSFDLYCDYHPDRFFDNAMEKSGVSEFCFPYKTGMWISGDTIKTKVGYGAPYVEL